MKMFKIVSASKIDDYESVADKLIKENHEIRQENANLKAQIMRMERGERSCGQHCEACKHAYVVREVQYVFGLVDRTYGCKMDARTACPDFAEKD